MIESLSKIAFDILKHKSGFHCISDFLTTECLIICDEFHPMMVLLEDILDFSDFHSSNSLRDLFEKDECMSVR